MVDITLFEVHLDDASFTANAPFSSTDEDEESGSDWGRDSGGGTSVAPLKAILAVVALAVLVEGIRRFVGRRGLEVPKFEELEDVTEIDVGE